MTFITVASHFRRAAVATSRSEPTSDGPDRELNMALYQLVRGTSAPTSSLLGHILLGDLYGNDSVLGEVSAVETVSSGQFITIEFTAVDSTFSSFTSYYSGCVLTMLDGPVCEYSTRIGGYAAGRLIVEPFDGEQSRLPDEGNRFSINGRPFNGTGLGYEPATGQLDAKSNDGIPIALLPHYSSYLKTAASRVSFDVGGTDESWDAVDYQYMCLAAPTPVSVPSFHRPIVGPFERSLDPRSLPRGPGHGPAEIDIGRLLPSKQEIQAVLKGRYGPNAKPGITDRDDPLSVLKNAGLPFNYADASQPSAYGSPPDVRGRGVVALDFTGHPVTRFMGKSGKPIDDPYESSPLQEQSVDRLYTQSDLERVLRMNDEDAASLPDR